jgi:hypothetical protein
MCVNMNFTMPSYRNILKKNAFIYSLVYSVGIIQHRGLVQFIALQWRLLLLEIRFFFSKNYYRIVDQAHIGGLKKSDTVFIFGSGYSLNSIGESEWREIERHDIIGFNFHFRQRFLCIDYHLLRELKVEPQELSDETVRELNEALDSPLYKDTVLLLQRGWYAADCKELISKKLLKNTHRILFFKNIRNSQFMSHDIAAGLTHGPGTITDCVNFAYCMGWKKIVLIGVDLYDSRYFWSRKNTDSGNDLPENEGDKGIHLTASNGIMQYLSVWRKDLNLNNVEIFVYNPKSLLSDVLPIYPRAQPLARQVEIV